MKNLPFHILRIGLGITFLWIGVLIFQAPEVWGGFIQEWARPFIPIPIVQAMIGAAILDIIVGILLLVNVFTWVAGFLGALHIGVVLITVGINDVTVRDIGLFAAAAFIGLSKLPKKYVFWLKK